MKDVVFVTPPATAPGFGLAGVRHLTAQPDEVVEVLQAVLSDTEGGVLALEETLAAGVGEKQLKELMRQWRGVLVTLPAPEAATPGEEDLLQRLVQRALGYHVRLEQ